VEKGSVGPVTYNYFEAVLREAGMKVLLGVGGSDDSFRALEESVERAREAGDELVVAVISKSGAETTPEVVERRVREFLDGSDVDAEVRRVAGDPPGSELVDVAEREGFDLVVLGGGDTSPMGKITVGSIAEFVLLNAHVSVKLVR
jgi:nucleotide-binding universal stress UspA family protein